MAEWRETEGEANNRVKEAAIGCLGGGRDLLFHQSPPRLSGDGGHSWAGVRAGVVRTAGLQLVDESFDVGKLLGQVTQVGFECVELLVEVVQSFRQWLDSEQEHS